MTRVRFTVEDAFVRWLTARTRDYEVYYTEHEIFAIPRVSTRPVVYAVLGTDEHDEVMEAVRSVIEDRYIYPIDHLAFDERAGEASPED